MSDLPTKHCPECKGMGHGCSRCGGTGWLTQPAFPGKPLTLFDALIGRIRKRAAEACGGTGWDCGVLAMTS